MKFVKVTALLLSLFLLFCTVSALAEDGSVTGPAPELVSYVSGDDGAAEPETPPAAVPEDESVNEKPDDSINVKTKPVESTAEAEEDTVPDYLVGNWMIRDLMYEAEAKNGSFSVKGTFQSEYPLTFGADGSMSSTLALDTMHKEGKLRFSFPQFEFTSFTGYAWSDGKLILLPGGPALSCEYDAAAGTIAVSYQCDVVMDEADHPSGKLPGGECSLTASFTLVPAQN